MAKLNTKATFSSLVLLESGGVAFGTYSLVRLWHFVFFYSEATGTTVPITAVEIATIA